MEGRCQDGGASGALLTDLPSPSQLDELRTVCITDVSIDPECAAVAKPCFMLGIHSVVVIPLKDADRLHGTGFFYKDHTYRCTDDKRTLLKT